MLCVDEKSQVQALDRSQPVLPMMPGMPEKRTHDYVRYGAQPVRRAGYRYRAGDRSLHRWQRTMECLKFLPGWNREVPKDFDVHWSRKLRHL